MSEENTAMSAPDRLRRGASRLVVCALACSALLAAGCGEDEDYKNEPRPPSPINVTAVITARDITLSPKSFGGGPINLIVSNQTDASQQLTIETEKQCGPSRGGSSKSTGPINPDGTATIKVDVCEGDYVVTVDNDEIRSADVSVGPDRPSAQNDLLQP